MRTKLFKCFATITFSAILAISGVAITAYAAVDPIHCSHNGLYIVDASGGIYEDFDEIFHEYKGWEERYCLDCFWYVTISIKYKEIHYWIDDACIRCGRTR